MQIADESPHEPGLSHAGRQREAERREITLKVGHSREFVRNRAESGVEISAFLRSNNLSNPIKNLQRLPLWSAQTESPCDGVNVTFHHECPDLGYGIFQTWDF